MNRIILVLLIISLLPGCRKDRRPAGVLSKQEMVKVLMEVYVAEEKYTRIGLNYDSLNKLTPYFRRRVLQHAGVQDSLFKKSMDYYLAHPDDLQYIYTALVDSLSLHEQSAPNATSKDAVSQ